MSKCILVAPAFILIAGCSPSAPPQPPEPALPAVEAITYARDIAPLLQEHCQSCHQAGGLGPFPLMTYSDAAPRAAQIKAAVVSRRMPHGPSVRLDTGCSNERTFEGPRRLLQSEIEMFSAWADEGAREGTPGSAPHAREATHHRAVEPDFLFVNDEQGFFLPPNLNRDVFRRFVIATDFQSDRFLTGFEAFPGTLDGAGINHVVHHVTLFIDASGASRDQLALFQASAPQVGGPGFEGDFTYPTSLVGMWFPGGPPLTMAAGCGIRIPRGASLVMEVHYGRVTSGVVDKTRLALHLAPQVTQEIETSLVKNENIFLPAGAKDATVQATRTFPAATTLYALTPHMHQLGTRFKVWLSQPGAETCLADVEWDFEHQGTYRFTTPLNLPAGASIRTECTYDNSLGNPNQPSSPPKNVEFGRASDREMCQLTVATSTLRQ